MTTALLAAFCASALAIIPTVNRDRDRDRDPSSRTNRGDETSIRNVRITPEALALARETYQGLGRIAVLPITVASGDPGAELAALGCTEAMTADLHYVSGSLVLGRAEVLRARREHDSAVEIGRALGLRYLVTGTLTRIEGDDRLAAEVIEVGMPGTAAKAVATRPIGQVFDLSDAVLLDLLGQLGATPPSGRLSEMVKVPTVSDTARALCDDGFAQLDRVSGVNRGDEPRLCARALKSSEAALKSDPRYLRASLLQAGCLLRLGETERLESSLTDAYNLHLPAEKVDTMTRLEIDGDYSAFAKHDFEAAAVQYRKMLDIDPGHLHALWMLAALHAGEYEPSRWSGVSLEKASEYAARLIVAHPESAAARLLGDRKP